MVRVTKDFAVEKIVVELDVDTAIALSKLLGEMSTADYERHGLDAAQCSMIYFIYKKLADEVE